MLEVFTGVPDEDRIGVPFLLEKARGYLRQRVVNIDSVLPFEFGPHATELKQSLSFYIGDTGRDSTYLMLGTVRGFDVVHDVDVDIV